MIRECTKCRVIQPLDCFSIAANRPKSGGRLTQCRACTNAAARIRMARNPGLQIEYNKKSRSNPEVKRRLYEINREWSKKNKHHHRALISDWRKKNPAGHRARVQERKALVRMGASYITHEMRTSIKDIYKECISLEASSGIRHHVDHIIPLRGDGVCGLHVPWNLQIITAENNMKKGNRFDA